MFAVEDVVVSDWSVDEIVDDFVVENIAAGDCDEERLRYPRVVLASVLHILAMARIVSGFGLV